MLKDPFSGAVEVVNVDEVLCHTERYLFHSLRSAFSQPSAVKTITPPITPEDFLRVLDLTVWPEYDPDKVHTTRDTSPESAVHHSLHQGRVSRGEVALAADAEVQYICSDRYFGHDHDVCDDDD